MFSPTSAMITLTTSSTGARKMVLSKRRSITASADAAALTWASVMARSFPRGPDDGRVMIGCRLGDVCTRGRLVVLRLVERLLGGGIAACQEGYASELP